MIHVYSLSKAVDIFTGCQQLPHSSLIKGTYRHIVTDDPKCVCVVSCTHIKCMLPCTYKVCDTI